MDAFAEVIGRFGFGVVGVFPGCLHFRGLVVIGGLGIVFLVFRFFAVAARHQLGHFVDQLARFQPLERPSGDVPGGAVSAPFEKYRAVERRDGEGVGELHIGREPGGAVDASTRVPSSGSASSRLSHSATPCRSAGVP